MTPSKPVSTLTREEAAALIETARTPRQKIVASLLRWTCLRASEAVSLADDDVDLEQGEIYVRRSKTPRGRRTVPILPQLEEPIREWRAYRAENNLEPARQSVSRHQRRRPDANEISLADHLRRLRPCRHDDPSGRPVTPHTLRRTFATDLLNHGVRLETVSRLLGHAATTITEQSYAQLTDQRIRAEVEGAFLMREPQPTAAEASRSLVVATAFVQLRSGTTKLVVRDGSWTCASIVQRKHAHPRFEDSPTT
jgi:integrase